MTTTTDTIDLCELLEAATDAHVGKGRGGFKLPTYGYVVIPDESLWDFLDSSLGALKFHLLARSERTGAFHNCPSVQKRVRNSKFSGEVANVGHAMSDRKANRFGTYASYKVNERRTDGFRSWFCHNVVAIKVKIPGQPSAYFVPASVDRWLNGGAFPWTTN